jgi:aminoglycoside 3-N-acetyltransferase
MKNDAYLIKLEKKILDIGIKKGSSVIICADVLKLMIILKKEKINFSPNDFIDLMIKIIGKKGTLIFYSFNWGFFNGKIFNHSLSKSFSGALSNAALERKDFKRSKSPVYSLLVYGKYQKKICSMNHYNCFSLKSPFGFLIKKKVKCFLFDLDYKNGAFPFFHVAEQYEKVYYRFFKVFTGKIMIRNVLKKISIKMFVRKNDYKITTIYSSKTDTELKKINALKKSSFFNIKISLLDVSKLYLMTLQQLKIEKKMILRRKSQ